MTQRKMPGGSLLLAGLAAFAYYKYSKLSPEKKNDLTGTIKEKGKQLYDKYVPDELKNIFENKKENSYTANNFTESKDAGFETKY